MDTSDLFGRVVDISAYLLERGLRLAPAAGAASVAAYTTAKLLGGPYSPAVGECGDAPTGLADGLILYHAPCHDSLDGQATTLLQQFGGFGSVQSVPHCCSEAGTLSLSRPDITDSMLQRKRESFEQAIGEARKATVLTNCPSCVQGLGRSRKIGVRPLHLAVALAERFSGADWKAEFLAEAAHATLVAF